MWGHDKAGRRARAAILAVGAIAAIALSVAPAAFAGKQKTVTSTVSVTGRVSGSARAVCPSGMRAFTGGFQTSAPAFSGANAQDLLIVNESRRSGATGWRVSASQLGTGSGSLTAIVYCRTAKLKQVVLETPLAAAGRSEATSTARCPKGSAAVSGGYTIPPASSLQQFTFATDNRLGGKRAWLVTGVRSSGAVPAAESVIAYAYCAAGDPLKPVTRTVSAVRGATNPLTTAQAGCAKGTVPMSGGFIAPFVQGNNAQGASARDTTFVTQSRFTKRGWLVAGQPFGELVGLTLDLTAFAYCK
jgi:hypothetical protein